MIITDEDRCLQYNVKQHIFSDYIGTLCEDDLLLTNGDNLLSICCKVKCRQCSNRLYLFYWLNKHNIVMPFISQNFDLVYVADIFSFLCSVLFVLFCLRSISCAGTSCPPGEPHLNSTLVLVGFVFFNISFSAQCFVGQCLLFFLSRFTASDYSFGIFKLSLYLMFPEFPLSFLKRLLIILLGNFDYVLAIDIRYIMFLTLSF